MSPSMSTPRHLLKKAFVASAIIGLFATGCADEESVASTPEPLALSTPESPAPTPESPTDGRAMSPPRDGHEVDGDDSMAAQWNQQGARVASCPVYQDLPSPIQIARWGWNIVEIETDAEPASESQDIDSPASPTRSVRLSFLKVDARIVRSSDGAVAGRRVLRYIAGRLSEAPGAALRAEHQDPLDGRPGRAAIEPRKRTFAIVFRDPYRPGDLVISATFQSEREMVSPLRADLHIDSFESFASAIRAARKELPPPVEETDSGEAGEE